MNTKLKVGAVSYMNTKPLIYGFEQGLLKNDIELIQAYPSEIATMLLNHTIDIGLLPIAALAHIKEYTLVGNTCISSYHQVASVCLFSNVPLSEIQEIYLDYQSVTSVNLLKLLIREHWNIRPLLLPADTNYISGIKGKTAGLIIGDRALEQLQHYEYVYDLAEAWFEYTNLPFVFACWVSINAVAPLLVEKFDQAASMGLLHLPEIIKEQHYQAYDLYTYYTKNIAYQLDEPRQKSMQLFLNKIKSL